MVLLVNALASSPQLWVIYVVAALVASLDALQRPSLDSLIPRVVAHDQLTAAGALTSLRWQFGQIVGPAVGGLLVAWVGVGFAYGVDVVTFVVSLALLWRLRPALAAEDADRVSIGAIVEGMRYAWSRKDLLGTYAVDLTAMIFAFPYARVPVRRRRPRRAVGARSPLHRTDGRRVARDDHLRMDQPRAPARPRHHLGRPRLGCSHHALRACPWCVVGVAGPRRSRAASTW